jgi:hypothetical protein
MKPSTSSGDLVEMSLSVVSRVMLTAGVQRNSKKPRFGGAFVVGR